MSETSLKSDSDILNVPSGEVTVCSSPGKMIWYIWDGLDNIVLPPLTQEQDSCTFAAVSRQTEYNIRITHAELNAPIPSSLPIVSDKKFEKNIRTKAPAMTRWWPRHLLMETLNEAMDNLQGTQRSGMILTSSAIHWLAEVHVLRPLSNERIKDLLRGRMPVVAVIMVTLDYPDLANTPYLGHSPATLSVRRRRHSHAVVIVGFYEADENNEYGIEKGTYWLYQNSFPKFEENRQGLLGNGINLLDPRLVIEIAYGVSYPDPVLLQVETPLAKKIRDYHKKLLDIRREHARAYLHQQGGQQEGSRSGRSESSRRQQEGSRSGRSESSRRQQEGSRSGRVESSSRQQEGSTSGRSESCPVQQEGSTSRRPESSSQDFERRVVRRTR